MEPISSLQVVRHGHRIRGGSAIVDHTLEREVADEAYRASRPSQPGGPPMTGAAALVPDPERGTVASEALRIRGFRHALAYLIVRHVPRAEEIFSR
jgi:hypothetical protein